jgi:hypothetical protein
MEKESEQLEALHDIRKMMRESSRFLSLSGLSGILAGVYALGGAYTGHVLIRDFYSSHPGGDEAFAQAYDVLAIKLVLVCLVVLGLSLVSAFVLSGRKARKRGHRLFDHSSKKLVWSMAVPLMAGGIFCFSLLAHGDGTILFICPAMLIFYGLALTSGSRFTLHDVEYLGYMQIMLGIGACFFPGHGLLFWSLGFGVLHIIYGSIMWYKYDRKS